MADAGVHVGSVGNGNLWTRSSLGGVQLRREEAIPGSDAAVYVSLSWKKRFFFFFPRGRSVYTEAPTVSDVSMCGYAVFIRVGFFNLKRQLPPPPLSASVLENPALQILKRYICSLEKPGCELRGPPWRFGGRKAGSKPGCDRGSVSPSPGVTEDFLPHTFPPCQLLHSHLL